MNLSSTIKSIQDIMRKDDGVDGDAQRLGQLTWMLFLKVFDQREEEWEDDDASYQSPLPEALRWRNWAAYVPGVDGKKAPQKAGLLKISGDVLHTHTHATRHTVVVTMTAFVFLRLISYHTLGS